MIINIKDFGAVPNEKNVNSVLDNREYHGAQRVCQSHGVYPLMKFCDRVTFNNAEVHTKK